MTSKFRLTKITALILIVAIVASILAAVIKDGQRQTVDTLISKKDLLFTKYLRNEKIEWVPRLIKIDLMRMQNKCLFLKEKLVGPKS